MWFNILVGYCAVCWFLAVVMTTFWSRQFAERALAHRASPLLFQLGSIAIAPLAMPLILWSVVQMLWTRNVRLRELRHCLRTVREYEFAKVNSLHLAEPIRGLFERHTPDLFQLGFNLIGDFRMKSKPVEVHDRILLSDDGETLATICALLNGGAISMISILSEGTSVHTSSSKNPKPERTTQPSDLLCINFLPGISIDEQFRQHLDFVRGECATRGATLIEQQADQFRAVLVYDQRIFNQWRFRHGDLDQQPPPADFHTLSSLAQTAPLLANA